MKRLNILGCILIYLITIPAWGQVYIGSGYYPEQVSKDRVEKDAGMMQEADLNMARVGDFAWAAMEPQDGNFSFDWLDNTVNVLSQRGMKTLLCTPTAAVPKWMYDAHPEIMQVKANGEHKAYGRRRHACLNNEIYRSYSARIARELALHYKNNPAIIGIQIDNELGTEEPYCYCPACEKKFTEWLQKKYRTIDGLNKAWGTIFWSETLTSFDQAWLPQRMDNPGAYLDYQRFLSDYTLDFFCMQRDEIKKVWPQVVVTTNIGGSGFVTTIDLYKLGKESDILSLDNYPINCTLENMYGNNTGQPFDPAMVSFAMQQIRGGRDVNFWVAEEQIGKTALVQREIVPDGYARLWTHQQMAYGCTMSCYFPFRSFDSAHEQLMAGVVESDYVKRDKYFEIKKTAQEIKSIHASIGNIHPAAKVAIVRDFDADWIFENGYTFCPDMKYLREVYAYYKALRSKSVMVDMVSSESNLNKYDLVIIPYLPAVTDDFCNKIKEKSRQGGVVVLTCLTGVRDKNFRKFDTFVQPDLQEMAGIEIERQEALFGLKSNTINFSNNTYTCKYWFDMIKPKGATVLSYYSGKYFKDTPAITSNSYGKGKIYYVATVPDSKSIEQLMTEAIKSANIKPIATCKDALVEVSELQSENGNKYLYLVNFSTESNSVELNKPVTDVVSGKSFAKTITLDALGYIVLKIN